MEYNEERPHSSLAYRTPAEFAKAFTLSSLTGWGRPSHPIGAARRR